jgi:hypothetical protein
LEVPRFLSPPKIFGDGGFSFLILIHYRRSLKGRLTISNTMSGSWLSTPIHLSSVIARSREYDRVYYNMCT